MVYRGLRKAGLAELPTGPKMKPIALPLFPSQPHPFRSTSFHSPTRSHIAFSLPLYHSTTLSTLLLSSTLPYPSFVLRYATPRRAFKTSSIALLLPFTYSSYLFTPPSPTPPLVPCSFLFSTLFLSARSGCILWAAYGTAVSR